MSTTSLRHLSIAMQCYVVIDEVVMGPDLQCVMQIEIALLGRQDLLYVLALTVVMFCHAALLLIMPA